MRVGIRYCIVAEFRVLIDHTAVPAGMPAGACKPCMISRDSEGSSDQLSHGSGLIEPLPSHVPFGNEAFNFHIPGSVFGLNKVQLHGRSTLRSCVWPWLSAVPMLLLPASHKVLQPHLCLAIATLGRAE